jgi:peptidoglycan hydrolase-like protein with peptidoglycan-binding domain
VPALGAVVLGGVVTATLTLSGATLEPDHAALARLHVQALGGSVAAVSAEDAHGHAIPLRTDYGVITPARQVAPGERIAVRVTVRRPGWNAWLIGRRRVETLRVTAPVAQPSARYLTRPDGATVTIGFDTAVARASYRLDGSAVRHAVRGHGRSVPVASGRPAGGVRIAVAARSWERLGTPELVRWFPKASKPVALVSPAPGGALSPADPIRLVFSTTVRDALGSGTPKLSPHAPGHWRTADSHTLVFTPTGYGAGFGTHVRIALPRAVAVASGTGAAPQVRSSIEWTVPGGSPLRLQQLLAQAGYLPLSWTAAGSDVGHTTRDEVRAAINPPAGHFSWRYPNTPHELQRLWHAGGTNEITRGAVMMFQDRHGLQVDAIAGPSVWKALISDAVAGKPPRPGYSYVYVHRDLPQLLTLWHDGHTVLTSPGNTGVPAAPTALGTFPVFEHAASTTMSGTNPDGSHYNDPGVKYVSYFNGGDALHAFNRASFGTPQSLGCVELPLASARRLYPYTPIGTLVTIER